MSLPERLELFVALMPARDVHEALADYRRNWEWPDGAWLPEPHRLHMTLAPLGEVFAWQLPAIRRALLDVPMNAFEIVLCNPAQWRDHPSLQPERHDTLMALGEHIRLALKRQGVRSMGRFNPHVTLAWQASGAKPPKAARRIHWPVHEFAIVWSKKPDDGPWHHEILARFGPNEKPLLAAQPLPKHHLQLPLFA